MVDRRLPGGYGYQKNPVTAAESQYLRETLIPKEDGWVISTVGEAVNCHYNVTAAGTVAGRMIMEYLPERTKTVVVAEARLSVATAVASSTVHTGLYIYQDQVFRLIPGTRAVFNTAATGVKQIPLSPTPITPDMRLFLGFLTLGGAPALEGFEGGATVTPRVVMKRLKLSQVSLRALYTLNDLPVSNGGSDFPMIAYLSKEAASVL